MKLQDDGSGTHVADSLFPSREERSRADSLLAELLDSSLERVGAGPVTPTIDMDRFRDELARFDFAVPRPLQEIAGWVCRQLEDGVVHITHPRYFGLFNPAPSFPALCADRIAAAFNPQLATWTTSPVAVEIEQHVIRAVGRQAGLDGNAAGCFTTGGAEANYTALLAALTAASPDFARAGARAFAGPPTFYISSEAHLTWKKAAHQSGIGRDAARLVATDGTGRIDVRNLTDQIEGDRARGMLPVMVVATAGTTGAGMIDPLIACAEVASRVGLWYHVDAAWGGGAIASDRLRPLLAGMDRADSVTIDAHKWFATTMGCGMFITTRPQVLATAFATTTSYMPSQLTGRDPYTASVQWSRRFVGLRLFLSLAAGGWAAYAAHTERAVALIERLNTRLTEVGWAAINSSPLAVLCIEPPAGSAPIEAIVRYVLKSGRAWVSVAETEGRKVLRACVTHGRTGPTDIDALAALLIEASRLAQDAAPR